MNNAVTPETTIQPIKTPITPEPSLKSPKSNLFKYLLIIFIIVLVISFVFILNNKNNKQSPIEQNTENFSEVTPTTQPTLINDPFVGFLDNKLYMKHRETVFYQCEKPVDYLCNFNLITQKDFIKNIDTINWLKVEKPKDIEIDSSFYGYPFDTAYSPQAEKGIFIIMWKDNRYWSTYIYDSKSKTIKELENLKYNWNDKIEGRYNIPKIDSFSNDRQFVSFKMFRCWSCEGHNPEILIYDIAQNKIVKRVGTVSDFEWLEGNSYRYKNYKKISCSGDDEGIWGICYDSTVPFIIESL